jgi:hypothetical protein
VTDVQRPDVVIAPPLQTKRHPDAAPKGPSSSEFDDQHILSLSAGDVLRNSEITKQLLAQSYYSLPPGEPLMLTVDIRDGVRRASRNQRLSLSRKLRDRLSTLLFAQGFEDPRFRFDIENMVVTAIRSKKEPPQSRRQVLSVVMPVYNERATFHTVIEQLLSKRIDGVDLELIVVESNSSDGTREDVLSFAEDPRVRVVLEDRPSGKGHAVRAGLAEATGDFVLIQDADLEYDLDDYESLLEPLRKFETAFVLGVRRKTAGARWGVRHFEKQVLVGWLMNFGNFLFLNLFNRVYGKQLRDPFTMYKVVRRDCLYGMRLESNRFDFDWELMAKLLRAGYEPVEVPVTYRSRSFSEGKKVSVLRDPLTWIRACFRYRFGSFEDPG